MILIFIFSSLQTRRADMWLGLSIDLKTKTPDAIRARVKCLEKFSDGCTMSCDEVVLRGSASDEVEREGEAGEEEQSEGVVGQEEEILDGV